MISLSLANTWDNKWWRIKVFTHSREANSNLSGYKRVKYLVNLKIKYSWDLNTFIVKWWATLNYMKKIDTEGGAQLENCISCFPSSNAKWNTSLWEQNGNVRKRRRNAVILKFTVFILLRWLQISNQNARTLTQAPLPLLRWLLGSSLLPLRPSKCLSPSFFWVRLVLAILFSCTALF